MPCCCIRRCTNRSEVKKKGTHGITFHLFPRDATQRRRWVRAVGREDWSPSAASVVCSRHFLPSCFYLTKSGLVRLLDNSVPSVDIGDAGELQAGGHNCTVRAGGKAAAAVEEAGGGGGGPAVLRPPQLTDEDPPKARELASRVSRLLLLCKRQRRSIRGLQRALREQSARLRRLQEPSPPSSSPELPDGGRRCCNHRPPPARVLLYLPYV